MRAAGSLARGLDGVKFAVASRWSLVAGLFGVVLGWLDTRIPDRYNFGHVVS